VVSVLASVSRVRGFEPGRSLPTEGKLNNLSHVPTLGACKRSFWSRLIGGPAAVFVQTVPSFANRWLSRGAGLPSEMNEGTDYSYKGHKGPVRKA
jgi:hypothetical protein